MSAPNQFWLLRERRFAPFFWTQFAAAANDNVFKNAFVVFVTFEATNLVNVDAGMIVNLIGALFILPFMLLSATSGQLADKYEKSRAHPPDQAVRDRDHGWSAGPASDRAASRCCSVALACWGSIRRCSARSSTRSCRST